DEDTQPSVPNRRHPTMTSKRPEVPPGGADFDPSLEQVPGPPPAVSSAGALDDRGRVIRPLVPTPWAPPAACRSARSPLLSGVVSRLRLTWRFVVPTGFGT